jgi:hypothetical protein
MAPARWSSRAGDGFGAKSEKYKETEMAVSRIGAIDRRLAIGGAFVGAAGITLPRRQSRGRVVVQRGMVGGGLARFDQGEAHFSLFASRLIFDEDNLEVVAGSVFWADGPAELTMTSTEVTGYNVLEDQPGQGQSRQIIGTMRVNGQAEYPFELVVTDAGTPGSELDTVTLMVGDSVQVSELASPAAGFGFRYLAAGPIVTGDIQEIDLEIDTIAGVSRSATPTH